MSHQPNILAIIPARSGSKGIPSKNLLKIGPETLIERAVRIAKQSKLITELVFSTDDNLYADLAIKAGADKAIMRPAELSDDFASSWDVVRHAVKFFEKETTDEVDAVILLQPTTPLRPLYHIDDTIDKIYRGGYDAAMTIREISYPIEWMFWLDNNQIARHVISQDNPISRRQDASLTYQPAGTAYALKRHRLFSNSPMKHENMAYVHVPFEEAINIDTMEDYYVAKAVFDETS